MNIKYGVPFFIVWNQVLSRSVWQDIWIFVSLPGLRDDVEDGPGWGVVTTGGDSFSFFRLSTLWLLETRLLVSFVLVFDFVVTFVEFRRVLDVDARSKFFVFFEELLDVFSFFFEWLFASFPFFSPPRRTPRRMSSSNSSFSSLWKRSEMIQTK